MVTAAVPSQAALQETPDCAVVASIEEDCVIMTMLVMLQPFASVIVQV
jgi:hypothetical protein